MKTIIIDSNNLLHKIPHLKALFLKDKEAAQLSLTESVKCNFGKGVKLIFVFDGFGKLKSRDVIFSEERTADEIIREKIENYSDHKKLKVVSSDNGISDLARVCGCETISSDEFWKEISRVKSATDGKNINQDYRYDKPEKPGRMSKKDLDEFRKYFT